MLKLRIKATILVFGVAMAIGIALAVAINTVSLNKVRIGGSTYDEIMALLDRLHAESMLDVGGGHLKLNRFALLHANLRRGNGVFLHYHLNTLRRSYSSVAPRQRQCKCQRNRVQYPSS